MDPNKNKVGHSRPTMWVEDDQTLNGGLVVFAIF